jgi:hypothetical protein
VSNQFLFQTKTAVIRGDSYAHVISLACVRPSFVPPPLGRPTATPGRGELAQRELTHLLGVGDAAFRPSHFLLQPKLSAGRD